MIAMYNRKKVKRSRPSLKTAHAFHERGWFEVDPERHSLSKKEHEARVLRVADELQKIVKENFPRTKNIEYAILKTHLILEHIISQYIAEFSAISIEASDVKFSFRQKLDVAYLLGFGANDPTLLPTVENLNKLRNQIVHSFTFDEKLLDEILRINHEEYLEFQPKNDTERIRVLRWICQFTGGRVAGEITSSFYISQHYGAQGEE